MLKARSQDCTTIMLVRLNQAIEISASYDSAKYRSIQRLRTALTATDKNDLPVLFDSYLRLYEEYKVFNYDSAFTYTRSLQATALHLGDPARTTYARLKLGFCLLSSGLFTETRDSLQKISIHGAPDSIQAEYYALMGRFYYDLGDFDNDAYNTPDYIHKENAYMDSALRLYPRSCFNYAYYLGLKQIKSGQRRYLVFHQGNSRDLQPRPITV